MDSKIVVGVGNIYACESLHKAGIGPERKANSVSKKHYKILTQCIKEILLRSIAAGGTKAKGSELVPQLVSNISLLILFLATLTIEG
jgi:formamidopyrimidine-DNA glycosylase